MVSHVLPWPPRGVGVIVRERDAALKRIRADRTGKILAAFRKHYAAGNYVDFINDWMCTYDPRGKISTLPFILFPKQADFIKWLQESIELQEDGVTEKSRDMGITWLCCAFAVCDWLFAPGSKIGFGSRKADLVDTLGDPDGIFEKMRFILRTLPPEFLPLGYNEKFDAPHMKIINRMNGSTIVGEGGDNIGRGGRNKLYFKDESAFYERPKKIDAALSQNSPVKIDVSTPNGTGNPFYDKAHNKNMRKFTFHWRDDPRKGIKWYNKEKANTPAFIVAQEIDIDYHASLFGVVIPAKYIRAAVNFAIPLTGAKKAGQDVADEEGIDTNALALGQGVTIKRIEEWNGINTTLTGRQCWRRCKDFGVEYINYDSIGVGAGVRGELSSLMAIEKEAAAKDKRKPYRPKIRPVNVSPPPKSGSLIRGKKNKDMFASMKSLYWWQLRMRFEKTYEHVNDIKKHNLDDLISIPDDGDLVAELSQATYGLNTAGKIVINKIGEGASSPNKADAVVLYFVPPKVVKIV